MKNENITNIDNLDFDKTGVLFYPCSGNDVIAPVRMFSAHLSDLWFVDRGYFIPGHQDTKRFELDLDAHDVKPILANLNNYNPIKKSVTGPSSYSQIHDDIEPCVMTQNYLDVKSNNVFNLHLRRGYGVSALKNDIRKISVFYYRGDSEGEGGSGTQWLNSTHFSEVLKKMANHGLIVTDGSQSCGSKQYAKFATFSKSKVGYESYINNRETFYDNQGFKFECVGFAGHRYGPTLIWKLTK